MSGGLIRSSVTLIDRSLQPRITKAGGEEEEEEDGLESVHQAAGWEIKNRWNICS